jgi:XRE family transcriptional regulator, regulator of sulfur utilization
VKISYKARKENRLIAQAIQRRRKAIGMTLPELAEQSGVSKGLLWQIESGKGNPCVSTLAAIADGLNIQMTYLFYLT